MVFFATVMGALIQWIGLRENFQESPKRIGTSMVSGEDVPLNQSVAEGFSIKKRCFEVTHVWEKYARREEQLGGWGVGGIFFRGFGPITRRRI